MYNSAIIIFFRSRMKKISMFKKLKLWFVFKRVSSADTIRGNLQVTCQARISGFKGFWSKFQGKSFKGFLILDIFKMYSLEIKFSDQPLDLASPGFKKLKSMKTTLSMIKYNISLICKVMKVWRKFWHFSTKFLFW